MYFDDSEKLFDLIRHIADIIEAMNVEKQKEQQRIEDMVNVNFSSFNRTSAKIHPEWESLLRLTQLKVTEELGPEFKLSKDISQYAFYAFSSLSSDIVSSILIFNMVLIIVDDHFDKYPTGMKV